jgi:2-polyprenyl-6-hydroxyphenyl methylase/3-demethylubiquinone-9 3-methyltransferase
MTVYEATPRMAFFDRHERAVREAFDAQEARFKSDVAPDDFRLRAVLSALEPLGGLRRRRVLDLGCGKGRFAAHLRAKGAKVVGLDLSAAMLAGAPDIDRVHASARRLPFGSRSFDAVVSIEMFEHLAPLAVYETLAEIARVLRPKGMVAIVDKSACALDARRTWLPSVVVKWIDERRGRWMYPARGPARERWLWPRRFCAQLADHFDWIGMSYLLSPLESEKNFFQRLATARQFAIWTGQARGRRRG